MCVVLLCVLSVCCSIVVLHVVFTCCSSVVVLVVCLIYAVVVLFVVVVVVVVLVFENIFIAVICMQGFWKLGRSHLRVRQRSLIVNSLTTSQPVCQQIDSQHFKKMLRLHMSACYMHIRAPVYIFFQPSLSCSIHKYFMQFSFEFSEIVHFQTTCSGIFINLFIWGKESKESLIIDHIN